MKIFKSKWYIVRRRMPVHLVLNHSSFATETAVNGYIYQDGRKKSEFRGCEGVRGSVILRGIDVRFVVQGDE